MAEPVSAAAQADPDDETTQTLPKNAEDRKAAAALSSLNENEIASGGDAGHKPPSTADQEALGKAMSRLEIASGSGQKKGEEVKKAEGKEAEVKKRAVKVSSEDMTLLVSGDDVDDAWIVGFGGGG